MSQSTLKKEADGDTTWDMVPLYSIVDEGKCSELTISHYYCDLTEVADLPDHGILSFTILNDDQFKAAVFGFGADQELSGHTASQPAMLLFLKGEATVRWGDNVREARAGTWIDMAGYENHSIQTKSPVLVLLLQFK